MIFVEVGDRVYTVTILYGHGEGQQYVFTVRLEASQEDVGIYIYMKKYAVIEYCLNASFVSCSPSGRAFFVQTYRVFLF